MTDKSVVPIDWSQPIEAVHEDGRVVPASINRDGKDGSHYIDGPDYHWPLWADNKDGRVYSTGWRIRNVASNPLNLETSDLDPITPEEDALATKAIVAMGWTRQAHDSAVRMVRVVLAERGWQPIETAPLGDADNGPFFDVCWQGETHRYLPVLHRETDCYNDGRGIKREHGYPSMTKVFLRKPTHWMPLPSAHSIQSGGEGGEGK